MSPSPNALLRVIGAMAIRLPSWMPDRSIGSKAVVMEAPKGIMWSAN